MTTITNIGTHRVRHGNVMDGIDDLMQGEKAAVMYSDPPWGEGNLKYWQTINKRMTGAAAQQVPALAAFLTQIFKIAVRHCEGFVFIEYGVRWEAACIASAEAEGLRYLASATMTYNSPPLPVHCHAFATVAGIEIPAGWRDAVNGQHSWKAARAAVRHAAQPGKIILDPCCGLGGTAGFAKELGMNFRGNELNEARLAKTIAKLRK